MMHDSSLARAAEVLTLSAIGQVADALFPILLKINSGITVPEPVLQETKQYLLGLQERTLDPLSTPYGDQGEHHKIISSMKDVISNIENDSVDRDSFALQLDDLFTKTFLLLEEKLTDEQAESIIEYWDRIANATFHLASERSNLRHY